MIKHLLRLTACPTPHHFFWRKLSFGESCRNLKPPTLAATETPFLSAAIGNPGPPASWPEGLRMTLGDVCEAPVCGVLQGRNPTIGPPLRHLAETPTLHARMSVITRRKATESLACADANDLSTFSSCTGEDYPLLLGTRMRTNSCSGTESTRITHSVP